MKYITASDIVSHFYPLTADSKKKDPRNRNLTVSVERGGGSKNLSKVEEGEAAMFLLDFSSEEQRAFTHGLYDTVQPMVLVGTNLHRYLHTY